MTTLYFQGKWAILDFTNGCYLVYDDFNGQISASELSTDPGPGSMFILYSTVLESTSGFTGYVQIQSNMNYIATGVCAPDGVNGMIGQCQLVPSAPDINSALTFAWSPKTGFTNAYRNNYPVGQGIGIIPYDKTAFPPYPYWGYYTQWINPEYDSFQLTILTPGLAQITQSQSWPKIDLSFVNLVGQDFSGAYQFPGSDFQQAVLDQVNFNGATLSGANFSAASLAGTNFTGATLSGGNFSAASLAGTNFTGATLSGANFTGCDLTTIIYDATTIVAATQAARGSFNSARLPFTLINRLWQFLDLTNSTVSGVPSPLSSSASVLQATGARLVGMNQKNFKGVTLENAVLNYADLDGLELSSADLTNASLINASLHGTNLSGATLVSANMTGAQLGSLGYLFTLPLSMELSLNAGQVSPLIPYFTQIGLTLSSNTTLKTIAANRVWELNDIGNNIVYSIRLEAPGAQVLTVYWPAQPCSLVNAYMPNAVLTGANLYGVLANNIQFYGSGALIDGSAVLEDAEFNGSNLSNVNFTQAQLLGTNLSDSYLFNAQFNGANLTPSANGVPTNLSDANLQGADFTDAQLFGANLMNAAVAINVPTKANPNQGGVYLFSLPYTGDSNTLQQYMAELNAAAATLFSLNPNGDAPTLQKYVTALETNNLGTLKIPFLAQSPPITFSSNATIKTIEGGSVWQIVDQPTTYTLWTDTDENANTELYAASALTKTQAAFQQNGITLRWQATATIDTAGQQWLLDNDSENPQNLSTGYVSFLLKLDGSVLDVYGTALRILRLGANNQQEYDTETCNVTVLGVTNMTGSTICPNGAMLSVNQIQTGETWDTKWLRASALPKPPTCVPTDFNWCPPTQVADE
jgi:uncharacterized protein YjbI with pentapeptide repeats